MSEKFTIKVIGAPEKEGREGGEEIDHKRKFPSLKNDQRLHMEKPCIIK